LREHNLLALVLLGLPHVVDESGAKKKAENHQEVHLTTDHLD
jgi:hypothetical protein